MYKIVFVVAVFAFALQGTYSTPVAVETNNASANADSLVKTASVPETVAAAAAAAVANDDAISTTLPPESTTPKASNGASTSQICVLLIQISSLALITKHVVL